MRQKICVRQSSDDKQIIQEFVFSSDLTKYNKLVKTYENERFLY